MSRVVYAVALLSLVNLSTFNPAQGALVLELTAANYNPTNGVWFDTSGNTDHCSQITANFRPTLVPGQTPNGSSVVRFDGNDFLRFTFGINSSAYTAFAFVRINTTSGSKTMLGGVDDGGFQYRIEGNSSKQQAVRQEFADLGLGTTALSTSSFYNINVTASTTGGSYRLNGAADGTTPNVIFNQQTDLIGTRGFGSGIVESFRGDIAAIRLYNTVLTASERAAVEAEFVAAYVTPVPEPGSILLVTVAGAGYAARRLRATKKGRQSSR